MKINDNQPISPPPSTRPAETRAKPGAGDDASGRAAPVERPAAKVELSSRSRELHEALRAANEAPDVRQDEVDRVREALREGRYEVDPRRIAERMLDRRA